MKIHLTPISERQGHAATFSCRRVVIGRGLECDHRLDDPAVSRRHCQLLVEGGELVVEDLGSRNGTFVNSQRITGRRPLVAGDVLGLPCGNYRVDASEVGVGEGLAGWLKGCFQALLGGRHATLVEVASNAPTENFAPAEREAEVARVGNFNSVDEAGEESFPASDPPAWTSGRA